MSRILIIIITLVSVSLAAHGQEVLHNDSAIAVPDRHAARKTVAAADSLHAGATINPQATADSLFVREKLTADSISKIIQESEKEMAKKHKHFVPDSQRALWLGIIFPGAGQIYNRKYWKLPIFYGGFLGCVYALNWNNQMYKDYRQAYLDIMDSDPNTASYKEMLPLNYDITGKEERFKELFKRKKDYYRHYRDMSMFAMIGVWALSVIDAYVDAELSTFDISPDLSLQLTPTIFPTQDMSCNQRITNTGVAIGLRF